MSSTRRSPTADIVIIDLPCNGLATIPGAYALIRKLVVEDRRSQQEKSDNDSRYLENWFKIMDCGLNFELTREGNGS